MLGREKSPEPCGDKAWEKLELDTKCLAFGDLGDIKDCLLSC